MLSSPRATCKPPEFSRCVLKLGSISAFLTVTTCFVPSVPSSLAALEQLEFLGVDLGFNYEKQPMAQDVKKIGQHWVISLEHRWEPLTSSMALSLNKIPKLLHALFIY